MSDHSDQTPMSREEMMSALFANLVLQQASMASMFLGLVPHPETGKPVRDLENAKLFIDVLEMLETKTKGNLGKEEEHLLKQSLTQLRMAFVEIAANPGACSDACCGQHENEHGKCGSENHSCGCSCDSSSSTPKEDENESKKRFTKKY